MLVVVKFVVKENLPHFLRTFNDGICVCLRSNRGVCNISGSRTVLVFQLPNQAPYQLGHTRIYDLFSLVYYTAKKRKKQSQNVLYFRKKCKSKYMNSGKHFTSAVGNGT